MDSNNFWLSIWKTAAIAICAVVVTSLASCQGNKYQIRKAIEAGATPMEAACAFGHGVVVDGPLCTIELMKD